MIRRIASVALAAAALAAFPVIASAHHFTSPVAVDCVHGTVSVSVTGWAGNVEIRKLPSGPVTEHPASGTQTITFSITSIGGNGNYTAGRQNAPTDPTPVHFTVECATPTPTPTQTATPTPRPSATPTAPPQPIVTPATTPKPAVGMIPPVSTSRAAQGATAAIASIPVPDTGSDSSNSLLLAVGLLSVGSVAVYFARSRK